MIQINLLPDVKREYLHAQQMKHLFVVLSILVSIIAATLLVLMFLYVQVLQPHHRKNIQADIDTSVKAFKGKKDAVKIVTVQGALEQLPSLKDQQLVTSRFFVYLKSFTPFDVSYSQVAFDTTAKTFALTGQTVSYQEANVLANNLKSAQFSYKKDGTTQTTHPFSSIVFGSLSQGKDDQTGKPVSFVLNFQFDPILFDQGITDMTVKVDADSDHLLLPPTQKPFGNTLPGTLTPGVTP